MLRNHALTFLIQINYVWSSYIDKFWMLNTKTLYYHKVEMHDSDYEAIISLSLQVKDFRFKYWNGLNLPKTGNLLIILDEIETNCMNNLLKQDGIQKSLFDNIWIIHSAKQESYIPDYFSESKVRVGINAIIFFVSSYVGGYNVTQVLGTGTFSVKYKPHGVLENLDILSIIQETKKIVDFEGTPLIANYANNNPPQCFVKQDGTIGGILPDILTTAAHFMNLTLIFQKSKDKNVGIWHKK